MMTEIEKAARRPSPPWYGAVTIGTLFFMAVVLLSYTLLDLGWQQRLGALNYWFVGALVVVISLMMRFWQADESTEPDQQD